MYKVGFLVILALLTLLAGCEKSTEPTDRLIQLRESFEHGLSDWSIRSLDTEVGTSTIDWHIVATDKMASVGSFSAEVYMDNLTDAAKIWLERSLDVEPKETYTAAISFDLASRDVGEVNTFQILANVLSASPETRAEVIKGFTDGDFPEGTYNGGIDGYVWLEKSVQKEITAGADGKLYIILGIWGTWECPRTYYFDNLTLNLTESQP
jgi:hypothetical protein